MLPVMDLGLLQQAVGGAAAAIRSVTRLQPVGGPGDRIFPATYSGGAYATEKRKLADGEVDCVLIDSVQSEANHAELALKEANEAGVLPMPLIVVDMSKTEDFAKPLPHLTSLDVPHRLADAILRDSELPDGTRFSKSDYARAWAKANLWNATPIFELCPTALVFGMWGSPDKPGGLGAKFERAYVSEIVAVDVTRPDGKRLGYRIDPLEARSSVLVDQTKSGFAFPKDKGGVPPSKINHGNIPFESPNAGLRCSYAEQTTVVSFGALRKLRFPIQGKNDAKADLAARTVLAALALCAGVLASERGTSLRSRCQLWPEQPREWELLERPGEAPRRFTLTGEAALALVREAVAAAKAAGLPWNETPIQLQPTKELLELIRKSQDAAAKESGDGE